jgi:hypothetical protein
MAPFDLQGMTGPVSIAFGFLFGFALERAGFGNANKLAGQFYFHDQTVLKVMFTAIVVAMVLFFLFAGLGFIELERVLVNPTHLWPAILGGLILGMGFIIGGYCPGTSVVSAATGKVDGLFFVLGCTVGIVVFGETVSLFRPFWEHSGSAGALTLPAWLGVGTGIVVIGVILMALGMFWGAEKLEGIFDAQA